MNRFGIPTIRLKAVSVAGFIFVSAFASLAMAKDEGEYSCSGGGGLVNYEWGVELSAVDDLKFNFDVALELGNFENFSLPVLPEGIKTFPLMVSKGLNENRLELEGGNSDFNVLGSLDLATQELSVKFTEAATDKPIASLKFACSPG